MFTGRCCHCGGAELTQPILYGITQGWCDKYIDWLIATNPSGPGSYSYEDILDNIYALTGQLLTSSLVFYALTPTELAESSYPLNGSHNLDVLLGGSLASAYAGLVTPYTVTELSPAQYILQIDATVDMMHVPTEGSDEDLAIISHLQRGKVVVLMIDVPYVFEDYIGEPLTIYQPIVDKINELNAYLTRIGSSTQIRQKETPEISASVSTPSNNWIMSNPNNWLSSHAYSSSLFNVSTGRFDRPTSDSTSFPHSYADDYSAVSHAYQSFTVFSNPYFDITNPNANSIFWQSWLAVPVPGTSIVDPTTRRKQILTTCERVNGGRLIVSGTGWGYYQNFSSITDVGIGSAAVCVPRTSGPVSRAFYGSSYGPYLMTLFASLTKKLSGTKSRYSPTLNKTPYTGSIQLSVPSVSYPDKFHATYDRSSRLTIAQFQDLPAATTASRTNISTGNLLSQLPDAGQRTQYWGVIGAGVDAVSTLGGTIGNITTIDGGDDVDVAYAPTQDTYEVSWTGVGDTTDLYKNINDIIASNTDRIYSANGVSTYYECRLETQSIGIENAVLHFRAYRSDAGDEETTVGNAVTLTVSLYRGTTLIVTNTPITLSATPTDYTWTIDSADITTMQSYVSTIRVRFDVSTSGSGDIRGAAISYASLKATLRDTFPCFIYMMNAVYFYFSGGMGNHPKTRMYQANSMYFISESDLLAAGFTDLIFDNCDMADDLAEGSPTYLAIPLLHPRFCDITENGYVHPEFRFITLSTEGQIAPSIFDDSTGGFAFRISNDVTDQNSDFREDFVVPVIHQNGRFLIPSSDTHKSLLIRDTDNAGNEVYTPWNTYESYYSVYGLTNWKDVTNYPTIGDFYDIDTTENGPPIAVGRACVTTLRYNINGDNYHRVDGTKAGVLEVIHRYPSSTLQALYAEGYADPEPPFATVEELTESGEWECPADVTSVLVECFGAGAGGGETDEYSGSASGGGGGGAYAAYQMTTVPTTIYTHQVGVGGVYGATPGDFGDDGEDTWFDSDTTVLAAGGKGGQGAVLDDDEAGGLGGAAADSIGTVKYSGGAGADGLSSTHGGGGGSSASPASDGTAGSAGVGGTSPLGGGNGGDQLSDGIAPGGGGGGKKGDAGALPGSGARGLIRLTYFE